MSVTYSEFIRFQACTEMVMPMTCSNESMFPPSSFSYKEFSKDCKKQFGVKPRPHWITTEFGGYVSFHPFFHLIFDIRKGYT